MPIKDRAKRQEYNRNYRRINPGPERLRARRYREAHREKHIADERSRNRAVKLQVLTYYGPNWKLCCSWPGCEIEDPDMLTLDHVNNDGYYDRLENRGLGVKLYKILRRESYPDGYQTLCGNHQLKKEAVRKRQASEGLRLLVRFVEATSNLPLANTISQP
jgi:hypothetical protein